jgi:hypothetical protein
MQNSSRSSLYEEITLSRDGTNVALEGRTINFSYFESLLSPYVTANLTYVDTGNGIEGSATDTQERFGTILNSLPIEGGGTEEVKFKITNQLGSLDFTTTPLKVLGTIPLGQESLREFVILKMVSEYAIKNENSQVFEKYYNNISNSVSSILTQKLGVPSNKITLDQTQNSLSFSGSNSRPFDLIISCARASIPLGGSPGFLFWETQSGFNYKAIDNIVNSSPVATYRYYGIAKTSLNDNQQNYRILNSPSYVQNQDIIKALRSGLYRTKNVGWNPYTGKYEEIFLSLSDSGIQTLGGSPSYNSEFNQSNSFARTNYFILDSGNNESGISTSINNNQLEYFAKAAMRYNLFMTQVLDITVPANPNLKAGDVINCEFEKVTISNKNEGSSDERQSGKYIILHLCHNFTPKRSFTSLRLVRDTYGLYTSGGL